MKTHIIIHHSVTPSLEWAHVLDSINTSHKQRGFPRSKTGYYIGYHAMIDYKGEILTTRLDSEIGAHAGVSDYNSKSIGVCLIGNFENSEPTAKQVHSLQNYITKYKDKYNIPKENVLYHGQIKPTACCGKNLIKYLSTMIDGAYGENTGLSDWESHAKKWAMDNELISNWDNLPVDYKQAAWFAEILRKFEIHLTKQNNDKNNNKDNKQVFIT